MTSDNIDSAASCRHTLVDDNNNDNDNSRRQTLGLINASIHVRHVERNSQNCKFGNVQCWLACDDTASINLYIDLQKELDYVEYKLTQNIRRVFRSEKTRIQLDLNTRLRLDIIITHEDQCQQLFEQLNRIKARPDDCDSFPRHQPKTGIARLDVGSVYLTAKNDLAPQLSPFTAGSIESSTSSKKRAVQHFIPTSESEHTIKKTRSISSQDLFKSYRQSNEVVDSVLSTSPPAPQTTPEKWRTPSSPTRNDVEVRLIG
ncbi:hypothetical protein FBU30_004715 [Linnemannia zychae]|nr:hypothetical protein FBU30_004715 [Linnemannia zychae]